MESSVSNASDPRLQSSTYSSHSTLNNKFQTAFFRCVGVWDTVGSFGLPEEISVSSKARGCPFGFPDRILGEHIERAYQALALNEERVDFVSFVNLKLFFIYNNSTNV